MNQFQFLENQSQPELSELDIFEQDFSPEGIQNLLNAGYEPQQINEMITNKYETDAGGQKIVPYVPTGAEQRVDAFGKFLQGLGSFGDQYLGGLFSTFEDPYEAQKMSGKLLGLVDPYQQGGIGEFLPGFSYELAKERKDRLGQALSLLDLIPGGALIAAPAKQAIKSSAKVEGILSLNKVYHGSPNKNLTEASISKSKQSENFMPHVSATDSPLLAKSFTKGELGNLPEGKIYESVGDFKIIDYTSDEGKKIWESLGKTDFERSINAKKAGFDGRKINNYEKLKIDNFYPDIDYKDVKDASEIQFFKNLSLNPFQKGIASLSDDALDLQRIIDDPNLSNIEKVKQFKDHPAIINAEKQMSEIMPTNTMPGYGTPEWAANRQFNFPNKDIVGYEDAVDELYKRGRSMAYVEQGLEVPVDIMASTPGKEKIATYVIGPPASGKSAISNPLAVKYNATIIDPDEAKKVLPEFQGGIGGNAVHTESQEIISDVAKIAIARGDNLVIPTVGAKSEKLRNNIRKLQDEGYTVNLVLADIDPNLAIVRMNSRFIKEGRLINSDAAADYAGKPNIVYDNFKMEGIADGYGKIDTTTRIGEPKQIFDDTAEIFKDTGL